MAHPGQIISNPITGERITFLMTSQDSYGQLLVFDCRVTPGGARLPAHVHATQEERFEVLSGALGVMLGGKKRVLEPGERIVLPAKLRHQWWNAGEAEVHFRVTVVPPRNLETVLEAVSGMAHAGKLNKRVMPANPFLLANLGKLSETYIPGVPIFLQRLTLAVGSVFGRLLGYDPRFAEYRTVAVAEVERSAA
jgi:mannose-6-phosphate isomerase-like protein (cupin superfamily)